MVILSWHHPWSIPPWIFLSPYSDMSPQYHLKKPVAPIQCWVKINCGIAFVWEMTYPLWSSSIVLKGGGSIILIKNIKIKCLAEQNVVIMIFWYLKKPTLDFDKCFKELQHFMMFLFLKSIISDNYPPY